MSIPPLPEEIEELSLAELRELDFTAEQVQSPEPFPSLEFLPSASETDEAAATKESQSLETSGSAQFGTSSKCHEITGEGSNWGLEEGSGGNSELVTARILFGEGTARKESQALETSGAAQFGTSSKSHEVLGQRGNWGPEEGSDGNSELVTARLLFLAKQEFSTSESVGTYYSDPQNQESSASQAFVDGGNCTNHCQISSNEAESGPSSPWLVEPDEVSTSDTGDMFSYAGLSFSRLPEDCPPVDANSIRQWNTGEERPESVPDALRTFPWMAEPWSEEEVSGSDEPSQLVSTCGPSDFDASLKVYHVSAVGTAGYKSPEGSVYCMDNHLDVMPPLSTKADIFSFELLLSLLFLNEEGPRSLGKMAKMLLFVNQTLAPQQGLSTEQRSTHERNGIHKFRLSEMAISNTNVDHALPLDTYLEKKFPEPKCACGYSQFGCVFMGDSVELTSHEQDSSSYQLKPLSDKVPRMGHEGSIVELESTIPNLQESYSGSALLVQSLQVTSYNGELIWKIPEPARRTAEARMGKTISLYSPLFYTSRFGYKMCRQLYLNGDGAGKDTRLSFFLTVMRGEYDALLSWPFWQMAFPNQEKRK